MMGMPFRVDGTGRVLVSWMSRDRVYWSRSGKNARDFGPRVATPGTASGEQAYPVALANAQGEILFVWVEGGNVQWAIYSKDGKPTRMRGRAGRLPRDSKPTAFLGTDDRFYVLF